MSSSEGMFLGCAQINRACKERIRDLNKEISRIKSKTYLVDTTIYTGFLGWRKESVKQSITFKEANEKFKHYFEWDIPCRFKDFSNDLRKVHLLENSMKRIKALRSVLGPPDHPFFLGRESLILLKGYLHESSN